MVSSKFTGTTMRTKRRHGHSLILIIYISIIICIHQIDATSTNPSSSVLVNGTPKSHILSIGSIRGGGRDDGTVTEEQTNNNNNNKINIKPISSEKARQAIICQYIRYLLNERLIQVLNGTRDESFATHYKNHLDKIDGQLTSVVSSHGRQEQNVVEKTNNGNGIMVLHTSENESQKKKWKMCLGDDSSNKNDDIIFPSDISSLDLTLPESIYKVLQHKEIQTKKKQVENANTGTGGTGGESMILYAPRLIWRAIQLGFHFTPVVSTVGLAAVSVSFRDGIWYKLIGRSLAKCGPAFIKWGQWASTRSDMFPDGLCESLSELHADAPAHSWRITQSTVEQALCIPKGSIYQIFESFERHPVASGSIAQIHRAVLRQPNSSSDEEKVHFDDDDENYINDGNRDGVFGSGTVVAVKVRHPNVSRLIDMDFRIMSLLANMVDRIPALSWIRVRDSVEQFSHTMAAQAHLNVEAHHLEVLNYNFRDWDNVGFPIPFFACSSVIIETFERGEICTTILDRYDELAELMGVESSSTSSTSTSTCEKDSDEKKKKKKEGINGKLGHEVMPISLAKFIVTNGLGLYLKMLLVDNLMHADLHPGNIMLDCLVFSEDNGSTTPLITLQNMPNGNVRSEMATKRASALLKRRQARLLMAELTKGFHGHITLVDAGMVAQLDEDESTNFIGLMASLGEGDGRSAAESVLRFTTKSDSQKCSPCDDEEDSYTGDLTYEEREAFIQDMIVLFDEKCRGYGTDVDVGEVLRGVLGVVKKHRVRIDANYATLVVNVLCIQGLAQRVCPSYNVLDAAKPLLRSHRQLCYTSEGKSVCSKSKPRRALMKVATPLLYMRKNAKDDRFFKQLYFSRRKRKGYHYDRRLEYSRNILSLGVILGAALKFLSSDEE